MWFTTYGTYSSDAAYVDGGSGDVSSLGIRVSNSLGVRPALKLDLSSVIFSSVDFVKLSGGAHATSSGSNPITDNTFYLKNKVPEVSYTYTADTDYCFAPFDPITSNGVTASRSADGTKVTVSGSPTGHVNITIPDAVPSHNHSFTYSAEGATITATCANTDGKCKLPPSTEGGSDHVAKLTIAANGGTYDGTTAYGATITDEYSIKGDAKVKYQKKTGESSYGTETETAPTNAGTYKASITLGTGNNSATASVEYTIAKRDIKVSGITAKDKTYDGNTDATLVFTGVQLGGKLDGDDLQLAQDHFTGAFADKSAGTGKTVNISISEPETALTGDAAGNYKLADEGQQTTATAAINKAMTNSVTVSIEGWTYGESPKSPGATATYGQDTATFAYSDSEKGEYKSDVPTNAGTWYVKATVAGTDNYVGAVSDPVEFTIAKKEVGLTWTDTELTYNGKAQKPKATATGLEDGDECTVTVDGEQTDANAKSGKDYYEAEAKALSNDNYKLPENVKAKFTIAPKELTQSMISLDSDTIKHDGTKKGPEVTMTDKDILVKDEDYTLSGDLSSSELGTHVITAEGKGNYTGSIETSWMMYSKKSNEQKEEGTGGRGDFEVFVDVENNSSDLAVDNLTVSLAKGFLTEEDMARYNAGENVLVYMIIREQPKSETGAEDRYILGQLFREEGATDISWYDITVWKKIGNSAAVQVHDTIDELSMSVEVPDAQKEAPSGYTREFYMGRSHDGASRMLAKTSEVKIGFSSSKFSTYALAYKDTAKPKPDSGKDGSKGGSSKGGTKTGDPNDLAGLIALMLASGGALGAMGYRRRRENQR